VFQHGVPRGKRSSGPRFSIIAWGRRRHINERNGGELGCEPINNMMMIRNLSTKDEDAEKKMKENKKHRKGKKKKKKKEKRRRGEKEKRRGRTEEERGGRKVKDKKDKYP